MSKKKTAWRLWASALGQKSGKNDVEANTIAIIRTFIFLTYFITNIAIVANAVRHWNDVPSAVPIEVNPSQSQTKRQ